MNCGDKQQEDKTREKKMEEKILEKIEEGEDNWEKEGGKKEMEEEGSQDSHSGHPLASGPDCGPIRESIALSLQLCLPWPSL